MRTNLYQKYKSLLIICCFLLSSTFTYSNVIGYAPQELIVRLLVDVDAPSFFEQYNATKNETITLKRVISKRYNIYLVSTNFSNLKLDRYAQSLMLEKEVIYCQKNYLANTRTTTPSDVHYSDQLSLRTIGVNDIWSSTTGGLTIDGDTIVVGIIDSGFDYLHEDLEANVWRNHAEIPNDGIDNDGNNYIDDYHSWNFRYENDRHDQLPNIGIRHGTAVAGIVGAVGDNATGIAGINWNIKMMLLSVRGYEAEIAEAYFYMLEQRQLYNETNGAKGAFVVTSSISLGFKQAFAQEHPIWCDVYDQLGQVGIINVGATVNEHYNVDVVGDIPSTCPSDFLIAVTNTNELDILEYKAGYGQNNIDLAAPGTNSFSTDLNDRYDFFGGTSAATPHVAGSIALLYSLPCEDLIYRAKNNPPDAAFFMKEMIMQSVDHLDGLSDKCVSGGRLNTKKAMEKIRDYCGGVDLQLDFKILPNLVAEDRDRIEIEYETTNFEEHQIFIHDSMGRLFYDQRFNPPNFEDKRLSIPNRWTKGIYIVSLRNSEGNYLSKKLIVF